MSFAISLGAQAQIAFRDATQAGVASTAGGAISYIGAGAISTNDAGCPRQVTPPIPAGANGDLLIAVAVAREDLAAVSASAGWTQLAAASYSGFDLQGFVYYRFATGADALTLTESGTCSSLSARVSRFRGVDAVEPFIGVPLPAASTSMQSSNNIVTGSEATAAPNAMLLVAAFINDNDPIAQGAGWSASHENVLNVARDLTYGLYYQLQTTAGAKSVSGWGMGAIDRNIGILFSLRPAEGLSIARPALTADSDVMVASIAVRPSTVDVAAPPGWVQAVDTPQPAGTASRLVAFTKAVAAVAGEPASYTFTFSGGASTGAAGGIASFSGVDTSSVIDAGGGNVTPSGVDHTANAVTTTSIDTMLVGSFEYASIPNAWSAPAGMAQVVDQGSTTRPNAGGISLEMSYAAQPAIGSSGNKQATSDAGGGADTGAAHLLALKRVPTVIFDIISGDYAVACAATPISITILARDSGGSLLTGYSGLVNLSTSSGAGNWSLAAGSGTLNNGAANDGAATYLFAAADGGMARLNLAVPAATSLTVTVQDAATGFAAASATLNFVADGYVILTDSVQVAGRDQTLTVEHRVSPGCGLSTANGHGGNNAVKVWLGLDPAHPAGAALPSATGATGPIALGSTEPGANNVTLNFGGPGALLPGQAPLTLSTTDAGKYILYVRDTNTVRRGTSPPITTRPFGLAFPGVTHGADETSGVLAAAGDNFALTVGAYLWDAADDAGSDGVPDAGADLTDNGLVPHFAWSTGVVPSANLPGAALGTLARGAGCASGATLAAGEFSGGAALAVDWCYSEAGNVRLAASAVNYLYSPGADVTGDSGLDGSGPSGGYVGRFRPKQFAVSGAALSNRLAASCAPASAFSYMDEGFELAFTLTAQNAQGATTQNYTGAYAKLALGSFTAYGFGATSGAADLSARLDDGVAPAGNWANGVASVTAVTAVLRAVPDNPDGPYAGLQIGIAPGDADGVQMDALDLDVDGNSTPEHKNLGVSTEVRFGRLRLRNAIGSERLAIDVPVSVQYWNGSVFAANTLDSCTTLGRDSIALTFNAASNLTSCETALTAATVSFSAGAATLRFAAPGAANNGSVVLEPQLGTGAAGTYCPSVGAGALAAVPALRSYLLGRWDDADDADTDPATAYDDDPPGRAAFGVYGAKPKGFIFLREMY